MFLSQLRKENKELFLKLSVYASNANDLFVDEEKELIYAYCREMGIPEVMPDTSETIDIILNQISEQADDVEKNIIILEILGLVKADGVYDEKEKAFMCQMMDGIKVKRDVLSQYNSLLEVYGAVFKEIRLAVCDV